MYYSIRHLTKFAYRNAVSESIMETRMHPRSDGNQFCLNFQLSVTPRCRVFSYRDHLSNHVHHFDIPGEHGQLVIVAESLVEMSPHAPLPDSLPASSWDDLDRAVAGSDYWEMMLPSGFTTPTPSLEAFADTLDLRRRDDPMSVLLRLNRQIYESFAYKPQSTRADSPIDEALEARAGVCQDFAHIMITMVRSRLRIPCRYVSGYLYHGPGLNDRSVNSATHAWVEAYLPELGWVGFDPTNNLIAGDRHIRTAIGRDYSDVPPTHGMYRGRTVSDLSVAVRVTPSEEQPAMDRELPVPEDWSILVEKAQEIPEQPAPARRRYQQAQQQQNRER
jgi:transglutaminase-like putative cysteine protease